MLSYQLPLLKNVSGSGTTSKSKTSWKSGILTQLLTVEVFDMESYSFFL